MNTSIHPDCEPFAETLSLLAAGCLPASEEPGSEVHRLQAHIAHCPACRDRYHELGELCTELSAARTALPPDFAFRVEPPRDILRDAAPVTHSRPRSGRLRVALFAASLLCVALAIPRDPRPDPNSLPRANGPLISSQATRTDSRDSDPPTWLALHRAAAESDESLNRLLARYAQPLVSEPLRPRSLWKDQLQ